ncbi:GNAT family N-acetyltransferase [Saccharothrix lopnurensis]|uniref:GNAT family N-acetyltransferase n=1 Tax=Saccharothrix lopnurensis TaxID=1670621 RepID=A0ABW1P2P7_9PSEU
MTREGVVPGVRLRRLDEEGLERLLALAVADADPADVMPPGWEVDRHDEFRRFYRGFLRDAYEVVDGGRTVGMARLTAEGEAGLWLARAARGRGTGRAVVRRLLEEAPGRGVRTVVASTTTGNVAAVRVLTALGAELEVVGGEVSARIAVPTDPPSRRA